MKVCRLVWFVSVLACGLGSTLYNAVRTDYEALLTAYEDTGSSGRSISADPIIPKDTTTAPIVVYLNMALYAIMDFDAVEGKMEIVGSVNLQWTDEVKTLKGVTFTSTADTLFFTQSQIWTPNLVLMNAVDSIENIGDETYKIRYNTSSGVCQWNPRVLILAACSPDPTYFPFDDQKCTLSIKPVGQESSLIILEVTSSKWVTSDLQGSSIWTLQETASSVSLSGGTYVADFKITIKRKPLFMTVVIVLPVLLLSLLSGFLFLLPPGSGERVGFGITCFLSFVVLLQTLMDLLPDSSDPMSLLCYYVILMLTLTAVLSIVNIFLLRIYISPGKDEVPRGFIYFYKTIRCRPCRYCYRKTKTKLKPPCMTGVDKIKRAANTLYTAVCSIRCQHCRRMHVGNRVQVHDRVHNMKFSTNRLTTGRQIAPGMSQNALEMTVTTESALDRDGMSIRSRKLVSSNGILNNKDRKGSTKTIQTASRVSDGIRIVGSQASNLAQIDEHPSISVTQHNVTQSSPSPSIDRISNDGVAKLDTDTKSIQSKHEPTSNGIVTDVINEGQEQIRPESHMSDINANVDSQLPSVEEIEVADDNSSNSSTTQNIALTTGGLENNSLSPEKPNSDLSSGYDSQQSDDMLFGSSKNIPLKIPPTESVMRDVTQVHIAISSKIGSDSQRSNEGLDSSQTIPLKIRSTHTPHTDVSDADIAVMSDGEDSSDEGDDDEKLLSSLTWEFVGQILDYFFIVTFIALQTTFTIFFIVPLGARSA